MTEKRGIIMDNNESHEIFKRKCKIVAFCKRKNQTAVDIAKYLGLNVTTIHHQLRELVQDGHLSPTVKQGNQKNIPKYKFMSYGKYKYNEVAALAMERRNKIIQLMQEPMTIKEIAAAVNASEDIIQADFQRLKSMSKIKLHSGIVGGRDENAAKWIAKDNYILTMQTEKVIYDDDMPDALRRMFGFDKSILNGLKGTMRRVHETIHPAPLKKLEYRGVASCAEMI